MKIADRIIVTANAKNRSNATNLAPSGDWVIANDFRHIWSRTGYEGYIRSLADVQNPDTAEPMQPPG